MTMVHGNFLRTFNSPIISLSKNWRTCFSETSQMGRPNNFPFTSATLSSPMGAQPSHKTWRTASPFVAKTIAPTSKPNFTNFSQPRLIFGHQLRKGV
jgi:hypothetical protein